MDTLITTLIPALLRFVGGIAGSLIAPWVHWGIEKKREKLRSRRELVKFWCLWVETKFRKESLRNSSFYSEIRPYLSPDTLKVFEYRLIPEPDGRGNDPMRTLLLDEISRIEREWNLV